MTRSSQGWYRHGIKEESGHVGERFSITLRCVNEHFKRSILVIGDSNTQNFEFGSGRGKFGESYPGKRTKAGKINQIIPSDCIGYANIIIVCGTNNLREEYINRRSDVDGVFCQLRYKVEQIKRLCNNSNIIIMPVLPTRLPKMNNDIIYYNSLLSNMVEQSRGLLCMPGLYQFLDNNGLLKASLTRDAAIHLNEKGLAVFVRCMKEWVFWIESEKSTGSGRGQRARGSREPP